MGEYKKDRAAFCSLDLGCLYPRHPSWVRLTIKKYVFTQSIVTNTLTIEGLFKLALASQLTIITQRTLTTPTHIQIYTIRLVTAGPSPTVSCWQKQHDNIQTKKRLMKLLINWNSRSWLAWLTSSTLFRVAEKTNKEELPTTEVWVNVCSQ